MKGIILAAGKGERLYPLTKAIPKVLLPLYDRPMIYYALDFMKTAGIEDVALVVSEDCEDLFKIALGDGTEFGLRITYRVQREINGTAGALKQIEDFFDGEEVLLYYGDNVLIKEGIREMIDYGKIEAEKGNASVIALEVANPTDYGVLEIDANGTIISLEEKPLQPKSNFIAPGIYFYPAGISEKLSKVELSPRGEYEMTSVNNMYLEEGKLKAITLPRETLWFDAGNFDMLLDAANIIRDYRKNDR